MLLAARHRGAGVFIRGLSAPLPPSPLISLALGYGLRETAAAGPCVSLALARCWCFGGVRPQNSCVVPRRLGEGAAEQEAKEAEELVNRPKDRQIGLGSWAVIARAFVLVSSPSWGIASQVATIALATAPAFQASPACWPGTLAGHGLVDRGWRWAPAKSDRPAVQERLLFRLSGGLFLLLSPSLPSGRPCLISGFSPRA